MQDLSFRRSSPQLPSASNLESPRLLPSTLSTSLLRPTQTSAPHSLDQNSIPVTEPPLDFPYQPIITTGNAASTGKGVLVGLVSTFGTAALVALIFGIIFFFRYTSQGRIFLDRIGRPGEYDDEQAYAREEAEALEGMNDLERIEYLRAKGMRFLWL
jgi:hypothetical protein